VQLLSPLDASFLHLERRVQQLDVGATLSLTVRTWAHLPQRMFSTVTTDVPLGAELRVTVGITSCAGRPTWGVTGDHESVPDLAVLARGIEQGLAELVATTTEQEVHHA
jgi:hypothetical protein